MKTGYYWAKQKTTPESEWKPEAEVIFVNGQTGDVYEIGCVHPGKIDHYDFLSKVERTTSVTVEQLEHEFEAVQVRHDSPHVLRRRSEFPVHRVTIKVDDVTTEIDGIVTGRQIGDSFVRNGFLYVHHADGSVTFQRDSRSRRISPHSKEETNG